MCVSLSVGGGARGEGGSVCVSVCIYLCTHTLILLITHLFIYLPVDLFIFIHLLLIYLFYPLLYFCSFQSSSMAMNQNSGTSSKKDDFFDVRLLY